MSDRRERVDERLDRVLAALPRLRAEARPDSGFASRVLARLPGDAPDALGWAAARLLPVTGALALVLAGLAVWTATGGEPSVDPIEEVTAWIVSSAEEAP